MEAPCVLQGRSKGVCLHVAPVVVLVFEDEGKRRNKKVLIAFVNQMSLYTTVALDYCIYFLFS